MRRLVLALILAVAPVAWADGPGWGDEQPRPMREREILRERPSGFWTSNKPAQGGAYRWRLLAIGGGLIAITGAGIVLLIRRANRERMQRQAGQG